MTCQAHGAAAVVHAQERDIAWVMHGVATGAFHSSDKQLQVCPPLCRIWGRLVVRVRYGVRYGNRVVVAQIRPPHDRQCLRVDAGKRARVAFEARLAIDVAAGINRAAGFRRIDDEVLIPAMYRAGALRGCAVVTAQAHQ